MRLGTIRLALSGGLLFFTSASVVAEPIVFTNRAAFDAAFPNVLIEGWDHFLPGHAFPNGSTAHGITYASSLGEALVTDAFAETSPPNGLGSTSAGFFLPNEIITFGFETAINALGIDINTFPTDSGAYTLHTDRGEIIASFFDPFSGLETGQFIGFSTRRPFRTVTISGGTFSYTLDTLRYDPVPEPATLILFVTGAAAIGRSAWKGWLRHRSVATWSLTERNARDDRLD